MKDNFQPVQRRHGDDNVLRSFHVIQCSVCGVDDAISAVKGRISENRVAELFTRRGWSVVGVGKHVCQTCHSENAKRNKLETKIKRETDMTKAAEVERSQAAQQKIPLLYMALDDAYDTTVKNYREGWSDERIARETGLSIEFVTKRREQDFGPVKIDTTLKDYETARKALAIASEQFSNAQQRLAGVTADFVKAAQNLRSAADKLAQKKS